MRFSFLLSTQGGSPLQVGLERGLAALGHTVDYFRDGQSKDFDVLIVFNQTAHRSDYIYPTFPDYEVPTAFVDAAEYGYYCYLPKRARAYANAFATSSMVHDLKSPREQPRLKNFLVGRSFPYFLMGYSKYVKYPENYYPLSYPLYLHSACHDRPNLENYLARPMPLFMAWGDNHPWRVGVTEALRAHPCKKEIILGRYDQWLEQPIYFGRLSGCRVSVASDGYGPFSFRTTEVLARTCLLMGPEHVVSSAPLLDLVHCVRFDIKHDGEEFVSTDAAEKLQCVLEDPEWAFRLYEAGYDHLMTKMTETATAQYFLDVLHAHDWSKPTPLEVR